MKYLVYNTPAMDCNIIIFPEYGDHARMVNTLGLQLEDIISAGFVNSNLECYGASASLNMESREEEDTVLLKQHMEL